MTQHYASKELVDRAKVWARWWRDDHEEVPPENAAAIVQSLANATELPNDAEHEAAIEDWANEAKGFPCDGAYLVSIKEIEEAVKLMRRAPQQPIDAGDANLLMSLIDAAMAIGAPLTNIAMIHDGTPCRLVAVFGDGIAAADEWVAGLMDGARPEPRASSALLEAAKKLVSKLNSLHESDEYMAVWTLAQMHCGPYRGPTYTQELDDLYGAIEAEEARGPSEVETLRKERDYWSRLCRDTIKQRDESENRAEEAVGKLSEANARAEKSEADNCELIVQRDDWHAQADRWTELYRKVVEERDAWITRAEKAEAALAAKPVADEPKPAIDVASAETDDADSSWRPVLSGWLERHDDGLLSTTRGIANVVSILVRRELARGAK